MKRLVNTYIVIIVILAVFITTSCLLYNYNIKAVSNDTTMKLFTVTEGDRYLNLGEKLKEANLIKSEFFYKIYIKIFKPTKLEIGTYELSESMDLKTIISVLNEGNNKNNEVIRITFKEGLNMRKIATVIASNTNNTEGDVFNTLENNEFIDNIINKYWFITNDIKNDNIYYSLEGYLFPDTYEFKSKDVSVSDIFEVMLDEMEKKLEKYKSDIEKSKYTVHELLTLASIIELEAAGSDDRRGVAGVFYNRLNNGWSLGSDVTTYYAEKVDLSERELTASEYTSCNAYNTRCSKMAGKLPIGPICNPSLLSIEAAIYPTSHDYFYFVADKNKKTYFNKTETEHNATIKKLKSENLWFEY